MGGISPIGHMYCMYVAQCKHVLCVSCNGYHDRSTVWLVATFICSRPSLHRCVEIIEVYISLMRSHCDLKSKPELTCFIPSRRLDLLMRSTNERKLGTLTKGYS